MILWLLPSDMVGVMVRELSAPSEEILGPSERGDLIDSLLGCLLSEALIDSGMHFDRTKVSSLSAAKSNCLQLLHPQFDSNFQYGRKQEEMKNPYLSNTFSRKMSPTIKRKLYIHLKKMKMKVTNYIVLGKG